MEMKIYLATFRVSSLSRYDIRLKNARPPIHSLTSPICLGLRRVGLCVVRANEKMSRLAGQGKIQPCAFRLSLPISTDYQSLRLDQVASVQDIRRQKIRGHRVYTYCAHK